VVYTSALGHYSVSKNVRLAGMGRGSLRKISTDARGRMKPDALAAQIREDRAQGLDPLFINATAGTTVLAAFDPIDALADVAAAEGVWLHVDGALGGSMLLSEKTRPLLAGLERADSFTWDAHKAMGVPVTCSVCLVREPGVLARHLAETADYLFQEDEALDRGQTSMQCGRRNDALKLWAAWQALGDAGFADRIDQLIACAQRAADCIERSPTMRLVKRPESVNVVFEVDGVDPDALCKALYAEGRAMVGHAQVEGATVMRLACVNVSATPDDVEAFFADVERTAAELRA
jgi:sulfinoalanine decarboxylase/sulfinoalanine decarboxylase/aspartate 1-decarboxylase